MQTDYDVIIIGAGPAGASCANHLVENRIKTLVIEKGKLPRNKCCSGLLSKKSQDYVKEYFGEIPENIYCSNKEFCFKFSKTGISFVDVPDSIWLKIQRNLFDDWLIYRTNAKILAPCLYKTHTEYEDYISIECLSDNKRVKFTCKYLIGADGGNSLVRKSFDKNFLNRKLIFVFQALYKGSSDFDKNCLYYLTGKKFSQEFGWFNYDNDLIVIGTSYYLDNKNNNYMNIITERMKQDYNLKIEKEVKREGCFIDVYKNEDKFCFGNNKNVLLIGESTGLLTIFGEGISSAFLSGYYAAKAILSNKRFSSLLEEYENYLSDQKKYIIKTWNEF